ncbi:MAG: DNA mismatch repair protein MutS [Mycoplasmatales bacterium]
MYKISDIDKTKLSSSIKQYVDIKEKHPDKVVLYQLGDFYEMFFDDAIDVSKLLELTLTSKSAGLEEKIPMAGVPLKAIHEYLPLLIKNGLKVVIVDQMDEIDPDTKLVKRNISKIISPGTFYDTNNINNNFIASISQDLKPRVSMIDTSTGQAFNFESNNLLDTIKELLKYNVRELVLDFDLDQSLIDLLKNHSIILNAYKYKEREYAFSSNSLFDEINNYLLEYLEENFNKIEHVLYFEYINNSKYMNINFNAQKQLELVNTLKDNEYVGSLFWFLNKTNTAMGRRLLKQYILRPLIDIKEIQYRQDIIHTLNNDKINTLEIVEILNSVYDFERIIGRLTELSISPKEMYQLSKSISRLSDLKSILIQFDNESLSNLSKAIDDMSDVYDLLNSSILENNSISIKDGGAINPDYNQELKRLIDLKDNSTKWILDFELQEKENTGISNLKVKYNKIFGYFIEIPNSNQQPIPDNYIRKQTMSNAERYITDELKKAESEILSSAENAIKLEQEIYTDLKLSVFKQIKRLKTTASLLAQIDVLISFALISEQNNYVRPSFNDNNIIDIKDGKHPIVNKFVHNFIVNDTFIDKDINTLLITGPNMSGKSTYMRQTALIVIMAQMGMYVPASACNIPLVDKIYTRIGASDDLSSGQSTFMVEMNETAEALQGATSNSLLIFDELGRGTSTYDGIALAHAIINYIHEHIGAKTLFSTHYHELTTISSYDKKVKNVYVKAHEEEDELTFYHKVLDGAVKKSYGIKVAAMANLPQEVISLSQEYLKELESDKEQVLKEIEAPIDIKVQENKTLNRIKELDINNLTPIKALEILASIKEEDEE